MNELIKWKRSIVNCALFTGWVSASADAAVIWVMFVAILVFNADATGVQWMVKKIHSYFRIQRIIKEDHLYNPIVAALDRDGTIRWLLR